MGQNEGAPGGVYLAIEWATGHWLNDGGPAPDYRADRHRSAKFFLSPFIQLRLIAVGAFMVDTATDQTMQTQRLISPHLQELHPVLGKVSNRDGFSTENHGVQGQVGLKPSGPQAQTNESTNTKRVGELNQASACTDIQARPVSQRLRASE